MSDERLGLPSASSFGTDALCPGRQDLLQSLGEITEPVDEFADRGTALHLCWQKEDPSGLDSEDTEIYERGLKLVEEAKSAWVEFVSDKFRWLNPPVKEGQREQRFYIRNSDGSIAASGQADRHYLIGECALICDFKSLWCHSLTPAELNWQLLLLAVLVAKEYELTHVRCVFVKPMFNKLDIVDCNAEDLKRAEFAVQQTLWNIKNTPQRRPGAHCRRCKGATACPEAKSWTLLPSVHVKTLERVTPTMADGLVKTLDLEDCVKIWDTATSRHNIEDAIQARLKSLPLGELAELGLTFGEPRVNRPITNSAGAWSLLAMAGVPTENLWKAVTMNKSELVTILQGAFGLTKKASEQWIKDKLTPFMTEKPCERPLVKI